MVDACTQTDRSDYQIIKHRMMKERHAQAAAAAAAAAAANGMSATSPRVHSNNPGSYGSSLLYHQRGAQGPPNNRGGNTLTRFPGQKQLQENRYGKGHSVSGRTGADSGQALFTP